MQEAAKKGLRRGMANWYLENGDSSQEPNYPLP
jgi:hypothetical protein